MKFLIITLLLILNNALIAQNKIAWHYRDYFGSRLELNADNSFLYTWSFDLTVLWTKGRWELKDDTIYLHPIPVYDTVGIRPANGSISDTLVLSSNDIPERFTPTTFSTAPLSSGAQNIRNYPEKLLLKKGRLYRIKNGSIVTKSKKIY